MTKRKKPSPTPAPDFSVERKEINRLVERVYEESKYLRFSASALASFSTDFDYSKAVGKLNEALNAVNAVVNIFNEKESF